MPETERPPTTYEQMVEAAADLLRSASDWLRQEAESTVREKVVAPLQRLGLTLAAAYTAANLFVIAILLLLIAALVHFGQSFGYAAVLAVMGAGLLVATVAALILMWTRMQR